MITLPQRMTLINFASYEHEYDTTQTQRSKNTSRMAVLGTMGRGVEELGASDEGPGGVANIGIEIEEGEGGGERGKRAEDVAGRAQEGGGAGSGTNPLHSVPWKSEIFLGNGRLGLPGVQCIERKRYQRDR